MTLLKNLHEDQTGEILLRAAATGAKAVATVRKEGHWVNVAGRLLAADKHYLMVGLPQASAGGIDHEFVAGESLAVSFKLKHHKYLFTTRVVSVEELSDDEGQPCWSLRVACPEGLRRLSRRSFQRVRVPDNRIVRASFWPGGREAEPAGGQDDAPVFLGTVTNLSAGGFGVVTRRDAALLFDVGFMVGVRLVFGPGGEVVYADAQCRHVTPQGESVHLGFQFVGLGHTAEGREALCIIGRKVSEFQRRSRVPAGRPG